MVHGDEQVQCCGAATKSVGLEDEGCASSCDPCGTFKAGHRSYQKGPQFLLVVRDFPVCCRVSRLPPEKVRVAHLLACLSIHSTCPVSGNTELVSVETYTITCGCTRTSMLASGCFGMRGRGGDEAPAGRVHFRAATRGRIVRMCGGSLQNEVRNEVALLQLTYLCFADFALRLPSPPLWRPLREGTVAQCIDATPKHCNTSGSIRQV